MLFQQPRKAGNVFKFLAMHTQTKKEITFKQHCEVLKGSKNQGANIYGEGVGEDLFYFYLTSLNFLQHTGFIYIYNIYKLYI